VLVELGLVEQRYAAVLEVMNEAASVTDVAFRFGVTRQTVHRWLRRYATDDPATIDRRHDRMVATASSAGPRAGWRSILGTNAMFAL
jgi:transposase-like protein